MRVLVVTNRFPPGELGGYELTCASFVDYLEAEGVELEILTSSVPLMRAPRPGERTEEIHRELSHTEDPGGASRALLLRRYRRDVAILKGRITAFRPDHVTIWGMSGLCPFLLPVLQDQSVPMSLRVGDYWLKRLLDRNGPERTSDLRARALRRLVGARGPLDLTEGVPVVFNSAFLREQTLDGHERAVGLTAVVPSGIEPDLLIDNEKQSWKGSLLYLGRIDPFKGVDTAVRAVAACPEPVRLRIIGGGETEDVASLRELIRSLNVDAAVTVHHAVSRAEARHELRAADALVFPVRWAEPWGKTPLEAMACGIPVIATGTGGSAEYLEDQANALLAPPNDVDRWASAIARLAREPELRRVLTANGRATAARYTEAVTNPALAKHLVGLA